MVLFSEEHGTGRSRGPLVGGEDRRWVRLAMEFSLESACFDLRLQETLGCRTGAGVACWILSLCWSIWFNGVGWRRVRLWLAGDGASLISGYGVAAVRRNGPLGEFADREREERCD